MGDSGEYLCLTGARRVLGRQGVTGPGLDQSI
jgi:hypothetical protein